MDQRISESVCVRPSHSLSHPLSLTLALPLPPPFLSLSLYACANRVMSQANVPVCGKTMAKSVEDIKGFVDPDG